MSVVPFDHMWQKSFCDVNHSQEIDPNRSLRSEFRLTLNLTFLYRPRSGRGLYDHAQFPHCWPRLSDVHTMTSAFTKLKNAYICCNPFSHRLHFTSIWNIALVIRNQIYQIVSHKNILFSYTVGCTSNTITLRGLNRVTTSFTRSLPRPWEPNTR